jgi:4-amino-4-deoxy-L-arabinose transferase-like glycosyltransferase
VTVIDWRRLLLIVGAAFALFSYGLGVGTLWDQDEAKYTEIAVEILRTGDPITLHYNGQPWFVHPPLFMWLQAATGRVVGFTEFAARLWSAVSAAAVVAETFLLAQWLYDWRAATLASAILATTLQFFVQARLAVFDPTLLAFMLAAFYMALIGQATGSRRAQLWAWAWAGLATATKGPIGLLLPAIAVAALAAPRREWSRWRVSLLPGAIVYAVIGLSWYVVETMRHGESFVRQVIGYYMVTRFFGVVESQPGPWWYYLPVLLVGTFPWTAFLPPLAVYLYRRRREISSQVVIVWIALILLFYSTAGTKLPNYVLPVYPFVAIGIASLCAEALANRSSDAAALVNVGFRLLLAAMALAAITLLVYGFPVYAASASALPRILGAVGAVLLAGPSAALALYRTGRLPAALGALAATLVIATPVLVHDTLPAVETYRPLPRIARVVRDRMHPGDVLGAVRLRLAASLVYYSQQPVVWIEDEPDLTAALCRYPRLFLILPEGPRGRWAAERLPPTARLQGEDGGYRIFSIERQGACPASGVGVPYLSAVNVISDSEKGTRWSLAS